MSNCVKQTLENFRFFVLPNNTITGINPPRPLVANVETPIATLTIPVDCDDVVWLSGTVGWLADITAAGQTISGNLLIQIHRDNEITNPIFSAQQSVTTTTDFGMTTSFSHVDHNFPKTSDCVTYILTVTATTTGISLTGPITFIAAAIENKRHDEDHKCEPKCENKCEPKCENKCEPKCKPHHKSYCQSYDFD